MADEKKDIVAKGTAEGVNPNIATVKEILRDVLGEVMAEQYESKMRKGAEDDAEVVRKNVSDYIPTTPATRFDAPSLLPKPKNEKGLNFARWVKYMAQSNGSPDLAYRIAKHQGDNVVAKAIGENSLTGGGAAVPTEFASEIIEELGANTVILQQANQTVNMRGSLILPFVDSSATASWVGENSNTTATAPTFGQIVLRDHLLSCVVPASNSWLKNAGPSSDAMLRDHIVRVGARALDSQLIRGLGVSNAPQGLRGMVDSSNVQHSNATETLTTCTNELGTMIQQVMDQNVNLDSGAAFLISPRTYRYLNTVRGAQDAYAFRDELARGTLMGYRYAISTNIPINLADSGGSGSDHTEVYFTHFPTMVFALGEDFRVEMFRGGSYYDGSSVVSGIAQDQTVFQMILACDYASQFRGKNIAFLDSVEWGT
jgi:HK97 family phage major capsid protein